MSNNMVDTTSDETTERVAHEINVLLNIIPIGDVLTLANEHLEQRRQINQLNISQNDVNRKKTDIIIEVYRTLQRLLKTTVMYNVFMNLEQWMEEAVENAYIKLERPEQEAEEEDGEEDIFRELLIQKEEEYKAQRETIRQLDMEIARIQRETEQLRREQLNRRIQNTGRTHSARMRYESIEAMAHRWMGDRRRLLNARLTSSSSFNQQQSNHGS